MFLAPPGGSNRRCCCFWCPLAAGVAVVSVAPWRPRRAVSGGGSATVSRELRVTLAQQTLLVYSRDPSRVIRARSSLSFRFIALWRPSLYRFSQGSVCESSNLDRGNRKKKIEEFSRSSREKLVQSKNKMFSKFTSILQHAVEAVSSTPRDVCVCVCVDSGGVSVCVVSSRPLLTIVSITRLT